MLGTKINKLTKTRFFKDSSYMVFSTIGMQLIGIATLPILSRLFSPDAFGLHGTYRSLIIIISIYFSLNLELAVVLPKKESEKEDVYKTTITTIFFNLFLISVVYFGVLFFTEIDLLSFVFSKSNDWMFFYVVLGAFFVAITNLNQSRLVSLKRFKNIALSRFILPIFFFLGSVILYYFNILNEGLIYGQILAYLILFAYLQKYVNLKSLSIPFQTIKGVYKKYKEIPLFTFPNTLLNTISLNLPLLILGVLYSGEVVGFYAIGIKLVSLPVSFISSSFSQIFYKKSVDIFNYNPEDLFPFVRKVMFSLLGFGIVVFTIIYFLIPYFVPYFLGNQWDGAIIYLQYICFWQALMIVNSPVSTLAILLKKQQKLLVFQVLYLLCRCLALWLPFYLGMSSIDSVLYYALIGVLFNTYLFGFLLKIAKQGSINIIKK